MHPLSRYKSILAGDSAPRFKDNEIVTGEKILEDCVLCERRCKVNRTKGEQGFCGAGDEIEVGSFFRHYGEEPFLIPSFTIFFIGCTLSCQFCQNYKISQRKECGTIYSEKQLAKLIDMHSDCRNVNFVGGEPTPYLPLILKTLKHVKSDIPIIWNSNFYMSKESMELLKGNIDIYLSDFKFGNNQCAERLCKTKNYFDIVSRNHMLALKDSELVIRHLVMPNHIECCSKPILKWIAENLRKKVIINIMDQYSPQYNVYKFDEINRRVNDKEMKEVVDCARKLELIFVR